MYEQNLKNLIDRIKKAKAEFQTVEVKRSQNSVTEKLYDTLSSFSNQDDGGVILFGIYEKNDFEITGVGDVQLLQKRVMEQCEQMEPAVRAVFTVVEINGKNVVSAEIPPVDVSERPCLRLMASRPQKVKKMFTSYPTAAAPVPNVNTAVSLSKSPLKAMMLSFFCSAI